MADPFKSWAILELMGHRRIAGFVQEVELGGGKLLRVDIPSPNGGQDVTQYYGTQAIYGLTPTDEETARALALECMADPVDEWSARRMLERYDAQRVEAPAIPPLVLSPEGFTGDDRDFEEPL